MRARLTSGLLASSLCLLAGCYSETTAPLAALGSGGQPESSHVFLVAIAPSVTFEVDSSAPGETTGVRVFLFIPAGVREALEVVIRAPADFRFNGFEALGPGATTGRWEFDFLNPDGVFEEENAFPIDHFALDADTAYSDSDFSGSFTPSTDPTVTHTFQGSPATGSYHVFTLALPFGGDGDSTSSFSRFDTDIRFTLLDGYLVNPAAPGDYTISISATSVDLDTGGPSDGMGDEPLSFSDQVVVTVPEPARHLGLGAALLAALGLARRRARPERSARAR